MAELPEEVGGAIRMVAFGVLVYVPVPEHFHGPLEDHNKIVDEAREIEKLVADDCRVLGWKIATVGPSYAQRVRGQFILLGKMQGSTALPTRPKIGQGTMQEVCRAAVDWLDKGPQPAAPPHGRDEQRYLKR